jgi:hypothetical protein
MRSTYSTNAYPTAPDPQSKAQEYSGHSYKLVTCLTSPLVASWLVNLTPPRIFFNYIRTPLLFMASVERGFNATVGLIRHRISNTIGTEYAQDFGTEKHREGICRSVCAFVVW